MSVQTLLLWSLACTALLVCSPLAPALAGDDGEPEEPAPTSLAWPRYSPPSGATETVTEYINTTPLAVPDNQCSTGWVSSVITVPDSHCIADVNVGVWMTHPFRHDVEMQLRAPDGTTALLIADLGGTADNINALFDDSAPTGPDGGHHAAPPPYYTDHPWRPLQPLVAFRGVPLAGDWSLDVCDDAWFDIGTLNQWSLFVETDVVVLEPPAQGAVACTADTAAYDLTVFNCTATTQPFTLTYTGNAWPASGPGTTGTLATGGVETITVTHEVPPGALPFDADTVTVTATGTVTDTATVTTGVPLVVGWADLAPLPPVGRPVRLPSVVYAGGKLYKIGGFDGETRAYLDIYDTATDTWSTGADMPAPRHHQDCVEIADKIYCAGGYSDDGTQDDLYIYDIATELWSTGAPMPADRHAYAGVALDGLYYVIGGCTTTTEATTIVYDPASNTWSAAMVPNMSVARQNHHAGVMGGTIYVAGGYDGSYLSSAEAYDPVAGAWVPVSSMPMSWVNGADGVLAERYLVIAGGHASGMGEATNWAWVYDPVTDSWGHSTMEHMLYGAEADSDGTTYWIASGRWYDGAYHESPWTTRAYGCSDRTNLAITKNDGATELCPGSTVDYSIEAINHGPVPVTCATVRDAFPPELSDVTWICAALGGASCTAAGAGDIDDSVDLPVGGMVTYFVNAIVDPGATGILDNTAVVSLGSVPDLVPADNQATDSDLLMSPADLEITKDDGVYEVSRGEILTYTIEAGNLGLWDAPGSQVTDSFSGLLTGVTWTCVGSGGGSCTANGEGDIADTVDLPVGASVVYTVIATVDLLAPQGGLANTATAAVTGEVCDPEVANNSATDLDVIVVLADLAITKDDGVTEVLPGDPITYTITVTNLGPDDTLGAIVTDPFPTSILDVTWTCAGSGGGACGSPSGWGNLIDFPELPSGGSVTYTATGTVDPAATGTIDNTASVAVTDATDPDAGNNSATDSDTIGKLPLPFADGFESGDTSAWSATVP